MATPTITPDDSDDEDEEEVEEEVEEEQTTENTSQGGDIDGADKHRTAKLDVVPNDSITESDDDGGVLSKMKNISKKKVAIGLAVLAATVVLLLYYLGKKRDRQALEGRHPQAQEGERARLADGVRGSPEERDQYIVEDTGIFGRGSRDGRAVDETEHPDENVGTGERNTDPFGG